MRIEPKFVEPQQGTKTQTYIPLPETNSGLTQVIASNPAQEPDVALAAQNTLNGLLSQPSGGVPVCAQSEPTSIQFSKKLALKPSAETDQLCANGSNIKKVSRIQVKEVQNPGPNPHQAMSDLFDNFAKQTKYYAAEIKAGRTPKHFTPNMVRAYSKEIPQTTADFIRKNPKYLTELMVNPTLGRNDLLQHHFSEPQYDQLRKYSDLFPSNEALNEFRSWVNRMGTAIPSVGSFLTNETNARIQSPPPKVILGDLQDLLDH